MNAAIPDRILRSSFASALLVAVLVCAAAWPLIPYTDSDAGAYLQMAGGEDLPRPFANRILVPKLVAALTHATDCSPDTAFRGLGMASVLLFAWSLIRLARRRKAHPLLMPLFLAVPFSIFLFRDYYLPDLPHAALVATFLAAVADGRRRTALAVMLAAGLVRESTILLGIVAGLLTWRRGERGWGVSMAVSAAAGAFAAWLWSGGTATGDVHGLGPGAYLMLKVPFNVAGNLLGVELWADTLPLPDPVLRWDLPDWVPGGRVTSVGIWRWNPLRPVFMLGMLLTTFGVMPAALLHRRRRGRPLVDAADLALGIGLAYGLIALALAPCVGSAVGRLLSYGWPALLVAAPLTTYGDRHPLRADTRWLTALHVVCAWLPAAAGLVPVTTASMAVLAVTALICHVLAYRRIGASALSSA